MSFIVFYVISIIILTFIISHFNQIAKAIQEWSDKPFIFPYTTRDSGGKEYSHFLGDDRYVQ